MVLLNILFPALVLVEILWLRKTASKRVFYLVNIALFLVLFTWTVPILISGYNYSSWILEYLREPFLLCAVALIICAIMIGLKRSKLHIIITFSVVFAVNIFLQFLSFFGASFGNSTYPYKPNIEYDWKVEDYYVKRYWKHGFAGPMSCHYVLFKTDLNDFVYKVVASTIENDTTVCVINFYMNFGQDVIEFNKCNRTIEKKQRYRIRP